MGILTIIGKHLPYMYISMDPSQNINDSVIEVSNGPNTPYIR